jgi:Protein of unknown function (DUF664)
MTWTAPTPPVPADEPLTGPDRPILEAFLVWQRYTLLNVCAGLDAEQLARRPLPSSNLSLLGLVRHLAKVERIWLRQRAAGLDVPPLHPRKDEDFDDVDPARAPAEFEIFAAEVRAGDEAVRHLPFDHTFEHRGQAHSLRLVHAHLISEYARHNGHADLLREAIDGQTGR